MSADAIKHAGLNLGGADELTHAQAGNAVFGFWVFLMSDAVLFALLFATYGVLLPATVGGPTPASVFLPFSKLWRCSPAASPSAWRRSR